MKTARKVIGIVLGILAAIFVVLLFAIYYFFFNTQHLPKGELIDEVVSPKGDYTVKTYLCNGGATVSYAVRGEVIYHKKVDKQKNIYWKYKEWESEIQWLDEHIVSINGIVLDVRNDVYDWRKDK